MDPLALAAGAGRVRGTGADVVGTFTFAGLAIPNGPVRMVKRYTWRHWVWYAGHYDGVGRMWGTWRVWAGRGPWEITLTGAAEAVAATEAQPAEAVSAVPVSSPAAQTQTAPPGQLRAGRRRSGRGG